MELTSWLQDMFPARLPEKNIEGPDTLERFESDLASVQLGNRLSAQFLQVEEQWENVVSTWGSVKSVKLVS